MSTDTILEVQDLVTEFSGDAGTVRALDRVGFSLQKNRTLGIVGESGCGKSVTSLSIMGLLPRPAGKVTGGRILYHGEDLLGFAPEQMSRIRGRRIAMIFQEPMTALNPVQRIGAQLGEVLRIHFPQMRRPEIDSACLDMLAKVGIPEPAQRLREYVHQLSGGMRQRVMIAMALACKPEILIADEPTTALDVTIQAQILELLKSLQAEMGMSVIFITHDLGVIARVCDEVVVMYAGKIVERAPVRRIYTHPAHPYTRGLLASIPRLDSPPKSRLATIEGMVPGLADMPPGCRFQNRCPHRRDACATSTPPMDVVAEGHEVACHFWREIAHAG